MVLAPRSRWEFLAIRALGLALVAALGISWPLLAAAALAALLAFAAAERWSGRWALLAGAADVAVSAALGATAGASALVVLPLTALGAWIVYRLARGSETAVDRRLRQADALNSATGALGASFELERLLEAIAGAASDLFGGAAVAIKLAPQFEDISPSPSEAAWNVGRARLGLADELRDIATRHAAERAEGPNIGRECLTTGEEATAVRLGLPQRAPLAAIALATPRGEQLRRPDESLLSAFVERVALALENALLYHRLSRRSDDLERAYTDLAAAHEELVRVDEMKTVFLSNVSHELRTPLTSIRSFSELLMSYDDSPEVRREFLTIINTESERLTRLVNDVLDITRIESGVINWQMEQLDPAELLAEVVRAQAPVVKAKGLAFHDDIAGPLPRIYGDRDRLMQVITNIMDNAVKFTTKGSVSLRARRNDGELEITIADTGIGIPVKDLQRIFDKFQQVGSTMANKPLGTGLGLSICREIVEHHGGRIWVDSELGKGSTFGLALPSVEPADRATMPLKSLSEQEA